MMGCITTSELLFTVLFYMGNKFGDCWEMTCYMLDSLHECFVMAIREVSWVAESEVVKNEHLNFGRRRPFGPHYLRLQRIRRNKGNSLLRLRPILPKKHRLSPQSFNSESV